MQTIGITGGIGSGKSTIARILKKLGFPVYIADREATHLINTHPYIRQEMITQFGTAIYTKTGELNKPVLADIIFRNERSLSLVNSIVHPRVMEDFEAWSRQQACSLVFFESAILFEASLDSFFDYIICVTAPVAIRLQRVITRDKSSLQKVNERIKNQLDDSFKCQHSDFIIYNDEQHPVIQQVMDIIKKLKTKAQ